MSVPPPALLVPPARLGRALERVRVGTGETTNDLVRRCGGAYDADFFRDVESGRAELDEPTVRWLAAVYGIAVEDLVPQRAVLVIDLEEGRLAVDDTKVRIDDPSPDAVLVRYLALVYLLRGVEPGRPVPIRRTDVAALAHALEVRERFFGENDHAMRRGFGRTAGVPSARHSR